MLLSRQVYASVADTLLGWQPREYPKILKVPAPAILVQQNVNQILNPLTPPGPRYRQYAKIFTQQYIAR